MGESRQHRLAVVDRDGDLWPVADAAGTKGGSGAVTDGSGLPLIGFTRWQEERLREIRAAHWRGDLRYAEDPTESRRRRFYCWLIETGRLTDQC